MYVTIPYVTTISDVHLNRTRLNILRHYSPEREVTSLLTVKLCNLWVRRSSTIGTSSARHFLIETSEFDEPVWNGRVENRTVAVRRCSFSRIARQYPVFVTLLTHGTQKSRHVWVTDTLP